MGLDVETARFLLSAKRTGVSFRRCLTLGRQNYFVSRSETLGLLRRHNIDPQKHPKLIAEQYSRFRYSEDFWEMIGVEHLDMLDASAYEGANMVHDLNQPVPDSWRERYDAVCDFGTIEHVFNVPVALKSCMEMVAPGGRFFILTPANNFLGHGFYQFSPELFHRVLCAANGFKVERMVAVEYSPRTGWFEVADPGVIQSRVALINAFPVMLFVQAQRTSVIPIFRTPPQQSDCEAQWSGTATPAQSGVVDRLATDRLTRMKLQLIEKLPRLARAMETLRFSLLNRDWTFRNRRAYRPVPPNER